MKKGILFFIVSIFLFLSSFNFTASAEGNYLPESNITIQSEGPIELWREYILVGDQWYVIIHYDDGSIEIIPSSKPPND
jgi:hypothetical protein